MRSDFLQFAGCLVLLGIAVGWHHRDSLLVILIESDLREFGDCVRHSELPVSVKVRLLGQIDFLRDRAGEISWREWMRLRSVVSELCEYGITDDEGVLIDQEFRRADSQGYFGR